MHLSGFNNKDSRTPGAWLVSLEPWAMLAFLGAVGIFLSQMRDPFVLGGAIAGPCSQAAKCWLAAALSILTGRAGRKGMWGGFTPRASQVRLHVPGLFIQAWLSRNICLCLLRHPACKGVGTALGKGTTVLAKPPSIIG